MKSAQIVVLRYGFVKGNGSTRTMVNGSATIAEVIPVVQRYSSKFQHPTKSRRSKTGDGLFDHTWREKTRATAHCWSDIPVAIAAVLPDCASGLLRQTSFLTTIGRGYNSQWYSFVTCVAMRNSSYQKLPPLVDSSGENSERTWRG